MVMEQLRRKEVVVVYDEITQTANIVIKWLRIAVVDENSLTKND